MAYRCVNAFSYAGRIIAGGQSVTDDDAILDTHRHLFVHVPDASSVARSETADAAPAVPRRRAPAKRATKK